MNEIIYTIFRLNISQSKNNLILVNISSDLLLNGKRFKIDF